MQLRARESARARQDLVRPFEQGEVSFRGAQAGRPEIAALPQIAYQQRLGEVAQTATTHTRQGRSAEALQEHARLHTVHGLEAMQGEAVPQRVAETLLARRQQGLEAVQTRRLHLAAQLAARAAAYSSRRPERGVQLLVGAFIDDGAKHIGGAGRHRVRAVPAPGIKRRASLVEGNQGQVGACRGEPLARVFFLVDTRALPLAGALLQRRLGKVGRLARVSRKPGSPRAQCEQRPAALEQTRGTALEKLVGKRALPAIEQLPALLFKPQATFLVGKEDVERGARPLHLPRRHQQRKRASGKPTLASQQLLHDMRLFDARAQHFRRDIGRLETALRRVEP